MKIHAGKFKNHLIKRVGIESTRETSAMVREAVFNMVSPISGEVLDLFAGSGSYGLTAFSLGAERVTFVDENINAYRTIQENISKLKISELTSIVKLDYQKFIDKNKIIKYDYIFLDPPYSFSNYEVLIETLKEMLNYNGKIILELDFKTKIHLETISLSVLKDKKYGVKRIIIFIK